MKIELSENAIQELISHLEAKIEELENDLEAEKIETFAMFEYMINEDRRDFLIEWINFVYNKYPESAKNIVAAFHDETIDLSTIECCKNDFNPW